MYIIDNVSQVEPLAKGEFMKALIFTFVFLFLISANAKITCAIGEEKVLKNAKVYLGAGEGQILVEGDVVDPYTDKVTEKVVLDPDIYAHEILANYAYFEKLHNLNAEKYKSVEQFSYEISLCVKNGKVTGYPVISGHH